MYKIGDLIQAPLAIGLILGYDKEAYIMIWFYKKECITAYDHNKRKLVPQYRIDNNIEYIKI